MVTEKWWKNFFTDLPCLCQSTHRGNYVFDGSWLLGVRAGGWSVYSKFSSADIQTPAYCTSQWRTWTKLLRPRTDCLMKGVKTMRSIQPEMVTEEFGNGEKVSYCSISGLGLENSKTALHFYNQQGGVPDVTANRVHQLHWSSDLQRTLAGTNWHFFSQ